MKEKLYSCLHTPRCLAQRRNTATCPMGQGALLRHKGSTFQGPAHLYLVLTMESEPCAGGLYPISVHGASWLRTSNIKVLCPEVLFRKEVGKASDLFILNPLTPRPHADRCHSRAGLIMLLVPREHDVTKSAWQNSASSALTQLL